MNKNRAEPTKTLDDLDLEQLRRECPGVRKLEPGSCEACLEKLEQELSRAEKHADLSRQVEILRLMGPCQFELKDYPKAIRCMNCLVKIARSGYPLPTLNMVYNSLGRINLIQGDFIAAAENFRQALELSDSEDQLSLAGGFAINLSLAYSHLGRPDDSLQYLQQAIDIYTRLGDQKLLFLAKGNLGNHYQSQGLLKDALSVKQECISFYTQQGDQLQLSRELSSSAVILFKLNQLEKAIANALEAIRIKEEHGDEDGIASCWINLGVFYNQFGDDESALRYYLKALPYYEKVGGKHSISLCLNNIGNYHLAHGEPLKALEYLLKATTLNQEIGDVKGQSVVLENIGLIYRDSLDDPQRAMEYFGQAIELCRKSQDDFLLNRVKLMYAVSLAMLSREFEALSLLEETSARIREQAYEKLYPDILEAEASVFKALSRFQDACRSLNELNTLIQRQHRAEIRSRIAEMQTRYETESKEREAEIYRLRNIELTVKNRQIEEQRNKLQETLDRLHESEIRYNFVSEELTRGSAANLVGNSETIRSISRMISIVAASEKTNVLITGETGTGKEIVARTIHSCSKRAKQHFYAVNCSAVPENLFESQFFGHEKDAFTGASTAKVGWFEIANNSTLFLDEIGSLSFDQQAKLLRALEERCIVRVGSHREIPIDLRVISATNVNLTLKVEQEEFRRDLYHRLAIFVINIPPLREHREDIPLLLRHFVGLTAQSLNKRINKVEKDVITLLVNYDFPGNVRELKNMVERAVLVADCSTLRREHFLIPLEAQEAYTQEGIVSLDILERDMILKALQATGYNRTQAAKLLGVERKAVERKILKHNINIPGK